MIVLSKKDGKDDVTQINLILTEIRICFEKCAMSLGINMSNAQVQVLCQDIFDRFGHDSLEDIQLCFKRARQGFYGFAHFKRDIINMLLFTFWMSQYLDEKAGLRERQLAEFKTKEQFNGAIPDLEPEAQARYDKWMPKLKKAMKGKPEPTKGIDTNSLGMQAQSLDWLKIGKQERARRLLYRLLMEKIEGDKKLSEREIIWLKGWNLI